MISPAKKLAKIVRLRLRKRWMRCNDYFGGAEEVGANNVVCRGWIGCDGKVRIWYYLKGGWDAGDPGFNAGRANELMKNSQV